MKKKITSIKSVRSLKNKRVLLRVDFNVPVKNNKVLDDFRLRASLPTIQFLRKKGAKVILITHLGRPEGKIDKKLRIDPLIKELDKLSGAKVRKLDTENWKLSDKKKLQIVQQIQKMLPGDVAILENIRFSPEEKNDKGNLSKELSKIGDMFVLDGFAVAHRVEASVSGVAKNLPSYAGLLLAGEISGLEKLMHKAKKPFVVVLGGAKAETKVPVIKNLLPKSSNLLIGGALFNTYLWAMGYGVGQSLVEKKMGVEIKKYCKKNKLILPIDVITGDAQGKLYKHVIVGKKPHIVCNSKEAILDIGPGTIRLFAKYIKKAKTLVWNGAMGYFEQKPYDVGTLSIARLIASRSKGKAFGVIGGGETVQSMELVGMSESVDLVSTGGGAMLEFLSGKDLPGIKAIRK